MGTPGIRRDIFPGTVTAMALIALFVLAVYANSIWGGFIWDDRHFIEDNVYIKQLSSLPALFTKHIGSGANIWYFSYRPVQMLTYMAEYQLWGLNAAGYHFTNVFLQVLAALSVYWMVRTVFGGGILPFFAAALFAVHPVHAAAVTYISGRADPLALIFMMMSFIFYVRGVRAGSTRMCFFAAVCYIPALLSRENSLILPVLFLLYHCAFRERVRPQYLLPALAAALAYIVFRLTVLRDLLPHAVTATTLAERAPGFLTAVTDYLRLLVLPFGLHMEYGNRLFAFMDPAVIAGGAITGVLLLWAFYLRGRNRLIFFSVCWFFAALLPLSNLYPIPIAYMAEHWLYVPSIGFFILVAAALRRVYCSGGGKHAAWALFTVIAVFYSCLTIRYNEYWKDPVTFYERTLKFAPESARTLCSLAREYFELGRKQEAENLFKRSIEVNPRYVEAHSDLGVVYYDAGKREEAVRLYRYALSVDPRHTGAYYNLGVALRGLGDRKGAAEAFGKLLGIDPADAEVHNKLGVVYAEMGMKGRAIDSFRKAIESDPDLAAPYFNLSVMYLYGGDHRMAAEYRDMAVKRGYVIAPGVFKKMERRWK